MREHARPLITLWRPLDTDSLKAVRNLLPPDRKQLGDGALHIRIIPAFMLENFHRDLHIDALTSSQRQELSRTVQNALPPSFYLNTVDLSAESLDIHSAMLSAGRGESPRENFELRASYSGADRDILVQERRCALNGIIGYYSEELGVEGAADYEWPEFNPVLPLARGRNRDKIRELHAVVGNLPLPVTFDTGSIWNVH